MASKAAKRNIGGGTWYQGGNSNVAKEAKERKDGGAVEKNAGGPVKKNKGGAIKRKYGGRTVGAPSGSIAPARLDKRARGGGIQKFSTGGGADKSPFSSAAHAGDKAIRTTAHGASISVGKHARGGEVKKTG